ncbi:MAG: VanZ family protein [Planctomycetaceae bacterium]|nr:VanZ family protein [Planctomycetaceae bacterium]
MKLATVVTAMTLAYWGLLFTLTHIPATQIPELGASDKLLHFVAYFVLAVGVGAHLLVTKRWNRFTLSIAMLVLMVFAGFDELTQLLVGR